MFIFSKFYTISHICLSCFKKWAIRKVHTKCNKLISNTEIGQLHVIKKNVIDTFFLAKFFFKIIYNFTVTFPLLFWFNCTFYNPLWNFCFGKIPFFKSFLISLFKKFIRKLSLKILLFIFVAISRLLISLF